MVNKQDIQDQIKLKKHAITLENDSNKLASLQNDLKILELRLQIESYKERIELLKTKN
ncbi:hypothetical protein [Tenacibaculum retecalamus]|uniref:hypothetical protein n=1 Tax=Tenacibaculum retecalamus TaxID=3018315 RepID=UPI0023D9453D|nr:hypothetical protein [Tenacibaculum retecalamus]WBX70880.1 hypothetical protein PG912_11720 [Tenacibaculum retecalamus]